MDSEETTLVRIYESKDCMGWELLIENCNTRIMLELLGALKMASNDIETQIRELEDD